MTIDFQCFLTFTEPTHAVVFYPSTNEDMGTLILPNGTAVKNQ